jgi:hypothetical protein
MEQQSKPNRKMVIAQSARTIFQVRFKMKDGVAILGVPRAGNLTQFLRDARPLAQNKAGKGHLVKLLIEGKLSGQKAPIQCR